MIFDRIEGLWYNFKKFDELPIDDFTKFLLLLKTFHFKNVNGLKVEVYVFTLCFEQKGETVLLWGLILAINNKIKEREKLVNDTGGCKSERIYEEIDDSLIATAFLGRFNGNLVICKYFLSSAGIDFIFS